MDSSKMTIIQGNTLLIRLDQFCDRQTDKQTPSYYIWTSLMIQKTLRDKQWDPIKWTSSMIQKCYMTNSGIQSN